MVEQFANNASSTLASGIDNATTSITLVDASKFSSSGTYRIVIESEIMQVTARSSNVLTVVRGSEGTIATSHTSSTVVTQIVTAGAVSQLKTDLINNIIVIDTFASRPSGTKGQQFIPTDFGYHQYYDGAAWRNLIEGKTFTQPPTASNWTIFNNGGTLTLSDNGGSLRASTNVAGQYAIATIPYVSGTFVEAAFFAGNSGIAAANVDNYTGFGVVMRDTTNRTTHLQFKIDNRQNAGVSYYWPYYDVDLRTGNGATYVSTQYGNGPIPFTRGIFILRLTYSGGTLTYSVSSDGGRNYVTIFSQTAASISFGTLSSYGLTLEAGAGDSIDMSVVHFKTG